mgnify:FL=1
MVSLFTAGSGRIIHSLADKSIRADRRRNFFLITTIALASCLIMSLALYIFGGSYQTRQFYRAVYRQRYFLWNRSSLPPYQKIVI